MSAALDVLALRAEGILARRLTGAELESFGKYLSLLRKWQRTHRLVGSTEPGWVVERLFLDSLLFLRVLPENMRSLADLGSGAGFPGIPIKIVRPDLDVTLIESRRRRVSFLSAVLRELGLGRAQVLAGRAEHIPEGRAHTFDAVTMRCAGNPEELLPTARALVLPGGVIVISGPPDRRPNPQGRWVTVEGVLPESTRSFSVYQV